MDPARAPGQSLVGGIVLVAFHGFERRLGSLENGVKRSSFRAVSSFESTSSWGLRLFDGGNKASQMGGLFGLIMMFSQKVL